MTTATDDTRDSFLESCEGLGKTGRFLLLGAICFPGGRKVKIGPARMIPVLTELTKKTPATVAGGRGEQGGLPFPDESIR